MKTDPTELATFLYGKDECAPSEVVTAFGAGPELWDHLGVLIKRGEVEVLGSGRLQWWGRSTPPSAASLTETYLTLKARLMAPTGSISPNAAPELSPLLELLRGLAEEVGRS